MPKTIIALFALAAVGRWWRRAPRNGTHAAVELPTVLPIRILQLSPAAQQLIDNNGTIRASASEFDVGTRGETGFEQMLRPPFRVARNRESGGCLTAGHLQ